MEENEELEELNPETLEEAKQIINKLKTQVDMQDKNLKSAYEQNRILTAQLQKTQSYAITELNSLIDQLRINYKTGLLTINNIKGGIYDGN